MVDRREQELAIVINARDQFSRVMRRAGASVETFRKRAVAGFAAVGTAIRGAVTGVTALAAALATGAIIRIGQGFIQAASEAEETESRFRVVFGELADRAEDVAQSISSSFGRSITEVRGSLATIQDTFVPLGLARDEAAGLSEALARLSIDVASFQNKADADVLRDFQSALVGNTETVRKYGIAITEADTQQELQRLGLANTASQASQTEKALARLSLIVAGSGDAIGDAGRTADSFANRLRRIQSLIARLRELFGEELIRAVNDAVDRIGGVPAVLELVARAFAFVTEAFKALLEGLVASVTGFQDLEAEIGSTAESIDKLNRDLGVVASGLGLVFAGLSASLKVQFSFIRLSLESIIQAFGFLTLAASRAFRGVLELGVRAFSALAGSVQRFFERVAGVVQKLLRVAIQSALEDGDTQLAQRLGTTLFNLNQAVAGINLDPLTEGLDGTLSSLEEIESKFRSLLEARALDVAEGVADAVRSLEDLGAAFERFSSSVGSSTRAQGEGLSDFARQLQEFLKSVESSGDELSSSFISGLKEIQEDIKKIGANLDAQAVGEGFFARLTAGAKQVREEIARTTDAFNVTQRALAGAQSAFSSFFEGVLDRTTSFRDAFRGLINDIVRQINRLIAELAAAGIVDGIAGFIGGLGVGGGGVSTDQANALVLGGGAAGGAVGTGAGSTVPQSFNSTALPASFPPPASSSPFGSASGLRLPPGIGFSGRGARDAGTSISGGSVNINVAFNPTVSAIDTQTGAQFIASQGDALAAMIANKVATDPTVKAVVGAQPRTPIQ